MHAIMVYFIHIDRLVKKGGIIMTLDELKEFEASHPQYKPFLGPIMKEIDQTCREEFGKAFRAINERLKARQDETNRKYNVPREDAELINEALTQLMHQIDDNIKANVHEQFQRYNEQI